MNSNQKQALTFFRFQAVLQSSGEWLSPAFVGVDGNGKIQYLSAQPPGYPVAVESVNGFAIPGFQNAHSHAFQYAMAGKAEIHASGSKDDFWSWREAMYACALSMDPDQMQAIASMLYAEMLRKGYTHVAEFHYLHHDKNGLPYAHLPEMGERLIQAAADTGIRITLIPVFYQKGGFGKDPQPRQRRFISKTVDDYFRLLEASTKSAAEYARANMGFSVHSLRAVDADDIITTVQQGPKNIPFHLHAAEQLREIEDCLAYLKQRPVEWVLHHLPADDRFHLVHCTHMNADEVTRLAKSGANAVLCPGTEGNLGDGIFRLTDFAAQRGSWSIGTDSHISLNPLEDLRWLDYAQRFTTHKRNTFDNGAATLVSMTWRAGRKAMGFSDTEFFAPGSDFDAVIFDAESPLLMQRDTTHLLPAILYSADSNDIYGTMIAGKWVVKEGHHARQRDIRTKFISAIRSFSF